MSDYYDPHIPSSATSGAGHKEEPSDLRTAEIQKVSESLLLSYILLSLDAFGLYIPMHLSSLSSQCLRLQL